MGDMQGLSLDEKVELAGNPCTPVSVLESLIDDPDQRVFHLALQNPSLPVKVAIKVIQSEADQYHRYAAALHPKLPRWVLWWFGFEVGLVRIGVAENVSAGKMLLCCLGLSNNLSMEGAVAKNPNTPQIMLRWLAKHEERIVLYSLAGNPSTPVRVLDELVMLDAEWVRERALGHALVSVEAVSESVRRYGVDGCPDFALVRVLAGVGVIVPEDTPRSLLVQVVESVL